jgi:hypothetical protein
MANPMAAAARQAVPRDNVKWGTIDMPPALFMHSLLLTSKSGRTWP